MAGMTPTDFAEKARVFSHKSPDDSLRVFEELGIVYQEDEEVGKLAHNKNKNALCEDGIVEFNPMLNDPRFRIYLESFPTSRFYFVLGADAGNFYTLTTEKADDRILILFWGPATRLEISKDSRDLTLRGVKAANLLKHIPYVQLHKSLDIEICLDKGGITIIHPNIAFSVNKGFAIGYGRQSLKSTEKSI